MSLFGVCYTHIIQICSAGSLEQAEWVIHFLSSSVEIIIREFCMGVCQDGSDIRLYLWEFSTFRLEFSVLMCMEFQIGVLNKLINVVKNTR